MSYMMILLVVGLYFVWQCYQLYKQKKWKDLGIFIGISGIALYYIMGNRFLWPTPSPIDVWKNLTEPVASWLASSLFGVNL